MCSVVKRFKSLQREEKNKRVIYKLDTPYCRTEVTKPEVINNETGSSSHRLTEMRQKCLFFERKKILKISIKGYFVFLNKLKLIQAASSSYL
jgi:hypothetical protein